MSSISADMSSTETDTEMSVPFSALFSTLLVSGSDQRLEWVTKNTARKRHNYLEWMGDILNNPQQLERVTGHLNQKIMNQVIDLRGECLSEYTSWLREALTARARVGTNGWHGIPT